MKTFKISDLEVSCQDSVSFARYENTCYQGIIFSLKNGDVYDICHNKHLGLRLLIKNYGGYKDIPFKESSFEFLPKEIRAVVLCEKA